MRLWQLLAASTPGTPGHTTVLVWQAQQRQQTAKLRAKSRRQARDAKRPKP